LGNVTVTFRVNSDWQSGFEAMVVIENKTSSILRNWKLSFDFDRTVNSIWNARVASKSGQRHTFDAQPHAWNRDIPARGKVSFGFIGRQGGYKQPPVNFTFQPGGSAPTPTPQPTPQPTPAPTPQPTPAPTPQPTPPPVPDGPRFSIQDASVDEPTQGTRVVEVKVEVNPAPATVVGVMFRTRDGSAKSGSDYQATSGTLLFEPGVTSKTIPITILSDNQVEGLETFTVELETAIGGQIARGIATVSIRDTTTSAGLFNYGEVLQKSLYFYDAQRSGPLPENFRVAWRGDSAMQDGQDVGLDLTGGFYDAGDHVKFGLPMTSSMTLLAWGGIEYLSAYESSDQKQALLDVIRWGTDWLIKAHPSDRVFYAQVGQGSLDHSYWGPPETMTMARPAYRIDATKPGSEVAGEAAAALAAAHILFKNEDPAYAETLLDHARRLFDFADQNRGSYVDSIPDARNYYNSYSGYYDELLWAAAWLHRATGETTYLVKAESLYNQHFAGDSLRWTHSWDGKMHGAIVLLAQTTGKAVYKGAVEDWLDSWAIPGASSRVTYTPGGLAWLDRWGSLRYSANTSLLAFIYADKVGDQGTRYRDFARSQINYMLGQNPSQRSYVVGFGQNPPRNPHHRAAHGSSTNNIHQPANNRHTLYGALVGGPGSPNDHDYNDDRTNYVTNEVALDYNAAFTGAVARMVAEFGGEPLENFPQE